MWLSGQQKRPVEWGEGQTGIVTMSEGGTAVLLESERRGLEVYAPAGYRWTPQADQRVLVIRGQGEIPAIVGVRQGTPRPDAVDVEAKALTLSGNQVGVSAQGAATVQGGRVNLNGTVYVNGERLEDLIARILAMLVGG
jgi:hypothetical protein